MRNFIYAYTLEYSNISTRWNYYVPLKVNVHVWRIEIDKLSTRLNLLDKGIELESLLCPVCFEIGESAGHLFSNYNIFDPYMAFNS